MLGEKIGEFTGKTVGVRIIDAIAGKVETSAQENGKLLGIEGSTLVTYVATMRPGGTMAGEGQGVFMTRDGEHASFFASGCGKPTGKGSAATWRGSLVFSTPSTKLARLNSVAVLFEYDIDENGNSQGRFWEWK